MEDCKNCKTWEENIYWKHFNTFHFTLILPPQFHDHLVLPKKFAQHMKSQLPDKVSLKGPSGAEWEVELSKTDDLLFVGSEWKDFVKAHDLKENCRLLFKFRRNSTCEVLIFEPQGCCEMESAYFVQRCRHSKSGHDDQRKRTKGDDSTEVIEDEGEEDSTFVVKKKSRRDTDTEGCAKGKAETQTAVRIPYKAPKHKGRPRRKLSSRSAVLSRKSSLINETEEEPSPMLQRDVITPENGGSLPKNKRSQKLKTQSKTNLNEIDVAKEMTSRIAREVLASENGEDVQAVDQSQQMNNLSGKLPNGDHIVNNSSQVSERGLITPLSGDTNRASDHPHNMKARSEKKASENDTVKESTRNSGRKVIRPNYREKSPDEDHSPRSHGNQRKLKKQALTTSSKKLEFKSETPQKEYKSNRRPVTEKEKREAFERAIKRETEHSFTTILPPTSVYKRFYLSVPQKWLRDHQLLRNQEVVLCVGDKSWSTTLFLQGKRSGGGISTGWKKFALDNNLEESDVLVFTLSSQKDATPVVLDVEIFRVLPITVPHHPEMS